MAPIVELDILPCTKGAIWPVLPKEWKDYIKGHLVAKQSHLFSLDLESGSVLCEENTTKPYFRVLTKAWLALPDSDFLPNSCLVPYLQALRDFPEGQSVGLTPVKKEWSAAIITLSDKGAQGLRRDKSGPALGEMLRKVFSEIVIYHYLLADDLNSLKSLLVDLALIQKVNIIITTGGTGVGPRDITPQATSSVLDHTLPGFSWMMFRESMEKTPHAAISRAVAGILGSCLIINVPGSLRGASENLGALLPALPHALAKINGDSADCGG